MPPLTVITGLGFITSIGNDKVTVLRNLRELRHGFEPFTFFDNPNVPVKVAGTVKDFAFPSPNWHDWRWPAAYAIDRETVRGLAPHGVYAFCAVQQALAEAGLRADDLSDGGTGLFCASAGSPYMLGQ
jgi:3-oxoacyl-[acyl-carrier-protein] synthase I